MAKRKGTIKTSGNADGLSQPKKNKYQESDVRNWSLSDVSDFLKSNGYEDEIIAKFLGEEISGIDLLDITETHLENWGIEPTGTRLSILRLFRQFKSNAPLIPFVGISDQFKIFNDPIHGHIEVHPLLVKIIDTPQFQRLRYLKQLGAAYYVFPGGCHNRFEHSLGVSHLAGQLVRALQSRQPELNISEEDILCVEIAGLCHDLGHGPFSHMFDGKFIPEARRNIKWEHEDASVQMFDYLVTDNQLAPEFEKYHLSDLDRTFITEQIRGPSKDMKEKDWKYIGRQPEKAFLYEIVANKRNGIDIDKFDYFARDCHHLGINNNFDHKRFMKFARVLRVDGELQICSRDKEVGNLYDMFNTRTTLHRRAYQHKSCNIVEFMIVDAFIKADDHVKTPGKNGKMWKISETIEDMVAYAKLDDSLFHRILYSTEEALAESRSILERIHKRQLYKCIGQTKPVESETFARSDDPKNIARQIVTAMDEQELGAKPLEPEDIIVQVVNYNYGKADKNPMDHVRFYKKGDPTVAIQVRKHEVSYMLPQMFAEQEVRVYVKKRDQTSVDTATKCFERWCASHKMRKPKFTFSEVLSARLLHCLMDGDSSAVELTPLKLSSSDAHRNESLMSINQPAAPSEDVTSKTARTKLY